jgi:glycosyltransferase involved in cell wall biosynthesis
VIIACLNEEATIATQLEALAGQQWSEPWELIVSDNGSTDETLMVVERYRNRVPNLRIVDASDKRGQPHALNVGVLAANSEALAFCDADDEVAPGWVAAMGEALRRYDFVAGPMEMKKLNPPWLARDHPQRYGLNRLRYPPYLPHAGSGNMGVKRAVHEAVGGFDESMPCLFDTDYCFKIQLAGMQLHFVPDAVLHARRRSGFGGLLRQGRNYGEYDVLLYKRYRPLGMPKLSWREGVWGWRCLLRQLPRIRNKAELGKWVWDCGWRLGRVKSCIRYRIFAL